ncbi:MAG: DNA polymerase III subunit epsilon [Rhodospirillaceae bacterium]|nr:DNA polymerase III subunit epsilon [Rhodospirillaceae bacterium]
MREIVLDTETTGFRQNDGDRIVEIGCLELVNHVATGNTYHQYINPERDMPDEAFGVHGLSEEFLSDFPVIADVMDAFIEFIGEAPLVIHNAEFDMRFINAELGLLGQEPLPMSRSIDTVRMAREKFPGAPASLDALCRRFSIDNSNRTLHGALLDAELLAEVYLELIGGRQTDLELAQDKAGDAMAAGETQRRDPRPHAASAAEKSAHAAFLEKIKDPVWTS